MGTKRFACASRVIGTVLAVAVAMGSATGIASAESAHFAEGAAEVGSSFASLSPSPDHFTYTAQADGETLLLKVSPEVHFVKQGSVTTLKLGNDTLETLPSTASSDQRGTVRLQYELVSPSVVRVIVNPSSHDQSPGDKAVPYGWWKDWGKCAAGIAGGAVSGATTVGLGGAAVGAVTIPIAGSVPGGAIGAVGGGIGGGLTGAVAAC